MDEDKSDKSEEKPKGFSNLEKFALLSGIIGLVADIISLSALFKISQEPSVTQPQNLYLYSLLAWVFTFIGISYSVFIFSYFILRITIKKHEENYLNMPTNLTYQSSKNEIINGVRIIVGFLALLLYLSYFIFVSDLVFGFVKTIDFSILFKYTGVFEQKTITFIYIGINFFLIPFISLKTADLMFDIGLTIFLAFDRISFPNRYVIEEKKEGCFIATAAYGSELSAEVDIFRQFRDEVLINSKSGRTFISFYYFLSPPFARLITKFPKLRIFVRNVLLNPMLKYLKASW